MTPSTKLTGLLVLAALCAGPDAFAQSYTLSTGTGITYQTIVGTGGETLLTFSSNDDAYASISSPISFPFFNQSVSVGSTIYVGTNGVLFFGTPSNAPSNTSLPTSNAPNALFAGFWDDLDVSGGSVYHGAFQLQSGENLLIVEYNNVAILGTSSRITFQIWIVEGGLEFDVVFGPSTGTGGSATIGLENSAGSDGSQATCSPSCTFANAANGQYYSWIPSTTPPPTSVDLVVSALSTAPTSVQAGGSFFIDFSLSNQGTSSSPGVTVGAVLSTDTVADGGDMQVGESVMGAVGASSSQSGSVTINVPANTAAGTYYVMLLADAFNAVTETNESNNSALVGTVVVSGGTPTSDIEITTGTLPQGSEGATYSFQLQQTGATNPAWAIVSGDPGPGMSLSTSGLLSGIPSSAGTFAFRAEASESGKTPGYADLVLTIGAAGGLRLTTPALPQAQVGAPYVAQLEAMGGAPPYGFLAVSGAPEWFFLTANGAISGMPDAPGVYDIEISVSDSEANFAGGTLRLTVVESRPLGIDTAALPPGVVSYPYSAQLQASGGVAPYTWTLSNGQLPSGVTLQPSGQLSGTPTEAGSFAMTFRVADGEGSALELPTKIEVDELRELVMTVPSQIAVKLNEASRVALTADGGVPPYTWTILSGTLPLGLTLDADANGAAITGVATSSIASTILLSVSDTVAGQVEQEIEVRATVDGQFKPTNVGARRKAKAAGCVCVNGAPISEGRSGAWLGLAVLVLLLRRRASD